MKRYYGNHPAKRDLKAHHKFMMLIKEPVKMKTQLELTETEKDLLKRIVALNLETKNNELAHASAYATELHDPDHPVLLRIWDKLNDELFR